MKESNFLIFMALIATLSLVGMALISIWVNKALKTNKGKQQ